MSPLTTSNATANNPLHFLAQVALDTDRILATAGPDSANLTDHHSKTRPPSRNLHTNLHVECRQTAISCTAPKPLRRSGTSNSLHSSDSPVESNCSKSRKRIRKSSRVLQKARADIKAKRREYMTRALKINTLDNSPVNNQQYAVLCMVYNEVTMYPTEAWMVLIALVIHRSLKQVKNWFSNERQKQKAGKWFLSNRTLGRRYACDLQS
ncbi:hypothetical protein FPV67DRAFT_78372 [Lyophyllum atratum]|nr:hypothetical protein FPV67DRAFT_78372 [Lyophyllum atratum]